jgi:hypothetical protein
VTAAGNPFWHHTASEMPVMFISVMGRPLNRKPLMAAAAKRGDELGFLLIAGAANAIALVDRSGQHHQSGQTGFCVPIAVTQPFRALQQHWLLP